MPLIQNSSLIHAIKADHLIIYLRDRKWLLLVMDGNTGLSDESIKVFEGSSFSRETYANMLAMRAFHTLAAICSFDLESRYWDAVNTFLRFLTLKSSL